MTQVFISYSRKDLEFVQRLAQDLMAAGLEVWYDLSGLEAGTRWGSEIQKAIKASQYFIVILSPNSMVSEWVEKEFLYAGNLKLKVIPILYKSCEIPMWFVNLHFIDMQDEKAYPLRLQELLKLMGVKPVLLEKKVPHFSIEETGRPKAGQDKQAQVSWSQRWGAWLGVAGGILAVLAIITLSMLWMGGKFKPIQPTPSLEPDGSPSLDATLTLVPATATEKIPAGKTIITIGEPQFFYSFDPLTPNFRLDYELMRNTGSTLLVFKPGTTDIVPGLATGMPVISADGLTYTFTLRSGIQFADGLELTAPLYASQLNRLLDVGPTCEDSISDYLAVPYLESITATDDFTLVFQLKKPVAFFQIILTLPAYSPSHPEKFPLDQCVQFPPAPIYGVGPWFISQYEQDGSVVLEPNPYYHGNLPPQVDQVIVRSYPDTLSLAQAVQNGEVDIAWGFYYTMQAELQNKADLTIQTVHGGPLFSLMINHTIAPTDDLNVDKAIASAIDRTAIANQVYTGNVVPHYSPIPLGMLGETEVFKSMFGSPDLEAARAFLAASGYDEVNKCAIDIYYPGTHYDVLTSSWMELIKQQLEATNVFAVSLHSEEWSTYRPSLHNQNIYPVGTMRWGFDYFDPTDSLDTFVFLGGYGTNLTQVIESTIYPPVYEPINNQAQQLVDLLTQAGMETNQTKRIELYAEAQDLYAELVVTIPLFYMSEHVIYRSNIHGSSEFGFPETLNIGNTLEFNYSTLSKTP